MERKEGRGRPGAPNSEEAPKSQSKPNQPEQSPHGGGIKSPEHQSLASVWDVLEHEVRLNAPDNEVRPRGKEYVRKAHELDHAIDKLTNRSPRDMYSGSHSITM